VILVGRHEKRDMGRVLDKLVHRMELYAMQHAAIGTFDGIGLVDFRGHPKSFRHTVECSLRLIRDNDPRRYARITKHIRWIANRVTNTMGIEYEPWICACNVEFTDIPGASPDVLAAGYACFLIHEATHGAIEARGIPCDVSHRVRIERLCMAEQNRFAARLAALDPQRYPLHLLQLEFNENYWRNEWSAGRLKITSSFLSRWFADSKIDPGAAPNSGPATQLDNSKTSEGPPSVS
jgi:hypothetical protein